MVLGNTASGSQPVSRCRRSVLLKHKKRHSGSHPALTSDSEQEHPPLVLPALNLLLKEKIFSLFKVLTFTWNPRGWYIKKVPKESLRNGPLG